MAGLGLYNLRGYSFPYKKDIDLDWINGKTLTVSVYATEELEPGEADHYAQRGFDFYGPDITAVYVRPDGEEIEIEYLYREPRPFERIRRITGYLVGTLDRFNDAKRAEESERVKHGI